MRSDSLLRLWALYKSLTYLLTYLLTLSATSALQRASENMRRCVVDTDVEDPDLREDVVVHEQRAVRVRQDGARRRRASPQVQGSLRVPARVDDERVPQPAQAMQHDESRRRPRLQGLRHRYTHRLRLEVLHSHLHFKTA